MRSAFPLTTVHEKSRIDYVFLPGSGALLRIQIDGTKRYDSLPEEKAVTGCVAFQGLYLAISMEPPYVNIDEMAFADLFGEPDKTTKEYCDRAEKFFAQAVGP